MYQVTYPTLLSQSLPHLGHTASHAFSQEHQTSTDLPRPEPLIIFPRKQKWHRALFVEVSYFDQKHPLTEAANQARRLASFFHSHYAHPREDTIILADTLMRDTSQPTRHLLLKAFEWLLEGTTPGDNVFFYYIGHANTDDSLFPVDFHDTGPLDMSELESRISTLQLGVRVILIIDSIWNSIGFKEMVLELARTGPYFTNQMRIM